MDKLCSSNWWLVINSNVSRESKINSEKLFVVHMIFDNIHDSSNINKDSFET